MDFLIVGASVTAQKKTGYAPLLQRQLEELGFGVGILGYGAGHFDDAGYFSMAEILKIRPSVLLLDWHTTGLDRFNSAKLRLFVAAMVANAVRVVFLLLPRVGKNTGGDRDCERQVKELSQEGKCQLVDLRGAVDHSKALYDGYHTSEYGARVYAEEILAFIREKELLNPGNSRLDLAPVELMSGMPESIFSATDPLDFKKFVFSAQVNSADVQDLCLFYRAGPYSPILSIKIFGAVHFEGEVSLFDAWCHVERIAYLSIWPKGLICPVGGSIFFEVEILDKDPDYSLCKKVPVSPVKTKRFPVQSIHASGFASQFFNSN